MKIEHITYDDAHGRSTAPPSNTQKLKSFINSKIMKARGADDAQHLLSEGRRPHSAPNSRYKPITEEEICAFLVRSHEQSRKEAAAKRADHRAQNNPQIQRPGSYVELKIGSADWNQKGKTKVTFSEDVNLHEHRKPSKKIQCSTPESASDYLARRRAERAAVASYEMFSEKPLTPKDAVKKQSHLKAKQHPQNHSLRTPVHERTASNMASYLNTSADILDSTRREIASSMRKGAEKVYSSKLTSPTFYLNHHQRQALIDDESDSDESFFCVGENREKFATPMAELEKKRRLSGDGTDLWLTGDQATKAGICKLCRQRLVDGKRLCGDCVLEIQPLKRKPVPQDFKPIPPPKDMKQPSPPPSSRYRLLHIASMASTTTTTPAPLLNDEGERSLQVGGVSLKANVVAQSPHWPTPQCAVVETVSPLTPLEAPTISRYEQWQNDDIQAEYAKAQEMFDRWSGSWDDEYVASPVESPILSSWDDNMSSKTGREDEVAMLPRRTTEKRQHTRRNSSFYAFWNDLLGQEQI